MSSRVAGSDAKEYKTLSEILEEIFRMIADEDEYVIEKERAAVQVATQVATRETSLKIAKNFLAIGTPIHVIANATELDPEEVSKLANGQ